MNYRKAGEERVRERKAVNLLQKSITQAVRWRQRGAERQRKETRGGEKASERGFERWNKMERFSGVCVFWKKPHGLVSDPQRSTSPPLDRLLTKSRAGIKLRRERMREACQRLAFVLL